MVNIEEIKKFLDDANKAGYATGDSNKWKKEQDNSTTIDHVSGDGKWKYHDNFFGGEPYGGREVVFYENGPVWMMVYYGAITDNKIDKNSVYGFLRTALSQADSKLPVRGPAELIENKEGNKWVYKTTWTGDFSGFLGKEVIELNDSEIYYANYSGGLVNLDKETI